MPTDGGHAFVNSPVASESLGVSLGPTLREHCHGCLGPIEWFHNGWQHSGAATGFARWTSPDGRGVDVLVKLPIGPVELEWTTRLAGVGVGTSTGHDRWDAEESLALASPRVMAAGASLGHYDLAWLIVERLPGKTLSDEHNEAAIRDLLHAAADFHDHTARARPVDEQPKPHEWEALIDKARHAARDSGIAESQRWNEAIKRVQRFQGSLISRWEHRKINTWCHGDLHPGNALRRAEPYAGAGIPRRGVVLIDLALVHPGHWLEDALYLERLFWARTDLLFGVKPVSYLAQLRRQRGLSTNDGYAELAMVRRVLMAACVPAFLEHEGHPRYQKAALEQLEKALPQVAK
ncbi:MAG: aminoglycoside phosphotransferase family protein [Phycisphaerales bacterium]|nr:aminoglycoside phosphotransferase family protein [Phycisphaerales bacterium]